MDKLRRMLFTGVVNVGILEGINGGCGTCENVRVAWTNGNCCYTAEVDDPRTGNVVSGGRSDVSACATAIGPAVVNETTALGEPTAVNAWLGPSGIIVNGSVLQSCGKRGVTAIVVAIDVARAVETTASGWLLLTISTGELLIHSLIL